MKQYNDCSAVGSASHFKGCQVLDYLFCASVAARRFLLAAALPWFAPELHEFSHA